MTFSSTSCWTCQTSIINRPWMSQSSHTIWTCRKLREIGGQQDYMMPTLQPCPILRARGSSRLQTHIH